MHNSKDTDSAISFLLRVCAQSGWSDRHRAGTKPEQEEETPQCFLDTGQAINSSGVCVPDLLTYCCHATVELWNTVYNMKRYISISYVGIII